MSLFFNLTTRFRHRSCSVKWLSICECCLKYSLKLCFYVRVEAFTQVHSWKVWKFAKSCWDSRGSYPDVYMNIAIIHLKIMYPYKLYTNLVPTLQRTHSLLIIKTNRLTFRRHAFSIKDWCFPSLQRTLFIYLINKYISLSDICLIVYNWYK